MTPDYLRRVLWQPPATRDPAVLGPEVRDALAAYGARPWQLDLVAPAVTEAILRAEEEPVEPDESRSCREPARRAPCWETRR